MKNLKQGTEMIRFAFKKVVGCSVEGGLKLRVRMKAGVSRG
jgi:hypothetical protein